MEHRRVDVHGHLYQWVDAICWEAVVVSTSPNPGRIFFTLEEAFSYINMKPQFMLIEHKCIRAFKLPATGSLTKEGK